MAIEHACDAPGHEVPDGDSAVVTADGQQGAAPVEGTGQRLATGVQDAIAVLE